MQYISTRGAAQPLNFRGATLAGLAGDGGLFVPTHWPQFSADDIASLAGLSYAATAARILAPFTAGVLDDGELQALTAGAYASFDHAAVTPLVQLDERHFLLELFHGPTLAFKDVALQLLGRLFERFLTGDEAPLTIVGATSGDTGSAAIRAVAGRAHMQICMLYPDGRVSDVQRRQMTSVDAPNVHVVAIDGSFDDAQAMVKRLFADADVTARHRIGAVNSINWARLAAQIVYYFYAAVRLGAPHKRIAFSVPTGNFGDVFAGYVAAQMGLPIERLIVATNINDILHRAIASGDYATGTVVPTASPSMDIQVSSNFERLLFDAHGRDGAALAAQMQQFDSARAIQLTGAQRAHIGQLFSSARVDGDAMTAAMQWGWRNAGQMVDPHSAIALAAAQTSAADLPRDVPLVSLATAHPAKFGDAVRAAIGVDVTLPQRLAGVMDAPEHMTRLPGEYGAVRNFVLGL